MISVLGLDPGGIDKSAIILVEAPTDTIVIALNSILK